LAKGSFLLLALVICMHYATVAIFVWFGKDVKLLEAPFHAALPVVAGLAGTTTAFYFKQKH
jgi:hypothetical protein